MSDEAALVELLRFLRSHSYHFTAVTPATHARVLGREAARRADLRSIFGWNRPFDREDLDPEALTLLERAGAIEKVDEGRLRSRVRVASLGDELFVHSAFPTNDVNAVFFGPDTYRFVRFVEQRLPMSSAPRRIVDMGAGTGAAGVALARRLPGAEVILVDVNPQALRFAKVNASAAGVDVEALPSDRVPDRFDLLIGNAPYLMDAAGRAYRDGGELLGGAVSLDWIRQSLKRLNSGSVVLLYSAAAYVDGRAPLITAIEEECRATGASLTIDEIDPDVFGDELSEPGYEEVERIAAIGIVIHSA